MDTADAARLTDAVTGAVADAVKRGESYSSLEDFLTDESVEHMTEAVIEETAETLGLADADDIGANEKKLGDSRVAALKDMAKESLTEQFRKDGELRDTAERVRQTRREGATRSDRILGCIERGEPNDYLDGIPLERYGNSVIIPAEYGTIYPDGKRYPVVVGPYAEVKRINKQLGLPNTQAHHVAQNAIYGKTVPKQQGVAVSLRGNAFTEFQSPHNDAHRIGEQIIDTYREDGTTPTNKKMYEIYVSELQAAGLNSNVIDFIMYEVIQQHMEYGILPGDAIKKMPRKIFFNYKEMSEDEKKP